MLKHINFIVSTRTSNTDVNGALFGGKCALKWFKAVTFWCFSSHRDRENQHPSALPPSAMGQKSECDFLDIIIFFYFRQFQVFDSGELIQKKCLICILTSFNLTECSKEKGTGTRWGRQPSAPKEDCTDRQSRDERGLIRVLFSVSVCAHKGHSCFKLIRISHLNKDPRVFRKAGWFPGLMWPPGEN